MPALLMLAAQFVPLLTKYLSGPDSTVSKVATDVVEIATSITGAKSPEEAIKQIGSSQENIQKFQLAVMDKQQAWDAMFLADVANARDRDVKLAQAGFRNNRANWLTAFAVVMVAAILAIVIMKSGLDEWVKGVLLLLLGRALGWVEQIFSFEFGTTKHSAAKDQTIANLSKDGDK